MPDRPVVPQVDRPDRPDLSPLEARVAAMIAGGEFGYREIARRLGMHYETLRSVLVRIRRKTGRPTKAELAVWATRHARWLADQAHEGGEE